MFLKGSILSLRALETSDIDVLYQWENSEALWHVSNTLTPYSKYVLEQYLLTSHLDIYANKQLRLMIELTSTKELIGAVDLFDFDPHNKRAGVGIMIHSEYRNKGYAQDSLKMLKNYAFNVLLLRQLYCNIGASNEASIRTFEKIGFEKIGLKKSWNSLPHNQFEDEWMLQLINSAK